MKRYYSKTYKATSYPSHLVDERVFGLEEMI